jgi:hypothetical protein
MNNRKKIIGKFFNAVICISAAFASFICIAIIIWSVGFKFSTNKKIIQNGIIIEKYKEDGIFSEIHLLKIEIVEKNKKIHLIRECDASDYYLTKIGDNTPMYSYEENKTGDKELEKTLHFLCIYIAIGVFYLLLIKEKK